jgi:2-hydroxy-3-oxopropionate reductase
LGNDFLVMKVGFIGLGTQGRGLAVNLVSAGYDVMVYDVRPEATQALAAAGARVGRSCADVGAHGEIVAVCVLDDAQLEAVMLGGDGIAAGARPGTIVIAHSTVRPKTIDRLRDALTARGLELVDAPVSGGERGAREKTMSYMAGGTPAAVEACLPLFATSGSKIARTGAPGTGIRSKVAHQLMVCVNMLSAHEGMLLGVKAGVAPAVLEQVINEGAAQSRVAEGWSQRNMRVSVPVFYKDLQICLEYAHELGIAVPGAALAQQLLETIVPKGSTEG